VLRKKKAFEQRGEVALSAWAEQQQREMSLKARQLSKAKVRLPRQGSEEAWPILPSILISEVVESTVMDSLPVHLYVACSRNRGHLPASVKHQQWKVVFLHLVR